MRWLAPESVAGFLARLFFLMALVTAANVTFATAFGDHEDHAAWYYVLHAAVVGGPFIVFFLTVSVFQMRLQRHFWQLSRKDALTAINNRRSFFALTNEVRAQNDTGVLMMLDADRFKRINDTHGHQAGDNCLKTIAYTLERSTRQTDILGRLGGEEFAIYLPDTSASLALAIGERLTIPITFLVDETQSLSVTMSIGAVVSQPDLTIDQLLAQADRALYRAKQNGRAQMVFDQVPTQTPNHLVQMNHATPASTSQ
ncbi:GGDEF domain-containing protein [Yoonia sp. F2084L]|uniref:GGDEF domain-containing protein n=1 Tax=Yoonia sp. F2084L TaxID=2926419 RepID=UPI001FF22C1D|nr:GGDEF domain-containing protein [Yoonia sp. F2084L]MCK0095889.1 GGDEF domain-containing protein [Yoonia sp. F2084L]